MPLLAKYFDKIYQLAYMPTRFPYMSLKYNNITKFSLYTKPTRSLHEPTWILEKLR